MSQVEILSLYGTRTIEQAAVPLICAVMAVAALGIWPRVRHRIGDPEGALRNVGVVLLVVALCFGLASAVTRASLFDDAYISLRYAKNLVDGHGLVWNRGEFVEGYTNFLWTIIIAGLMAVTRLQGPLVSVVLCLASYVANVLVVYLLSRRIGGEGRGGWILIAPPLFAVQSIVVGYATTGLETQFASLLVNLGVLFLIRPSSFRNALLAGFFFILATLTRPDHAIFYASGSLAVCLGCAREARAAGTTGLANALRKSWRPIAGFSLPFLLYLAHLAFRVAYYGEWWPNTYYAKLAYMPYYQQGSRYLLLFILASHYWVVALIWFAGFLSAPANETHRRYRYFVVPAVALYVFYVVRVGGDFMHGRFFLSVMPLALIGAEQSCRQLWRERKPWGRVPAVLLVATAFGVHLHEANERIWQVTEETNVYPIARWRPTIVVNDYNYRAGQAFGRLAQAGMDPIISSTSSGMVGYYSGLRVVDQYGLTDHYVARLPVSGRTRPGHERSAPREYLLERGVWIARRRPPPEPYARLPSLSLGPGTGGRHWYFLYYDADAARELRRVLPDSKFVDFERYLDDYLQKANRTKSRLSPTKWRASARRKIEDDLRWFDQYYFDHNEDPGRRAGFEKLLADHT